MIPLKFTKISSNFFTSEEFSFCFSEAKSSGVDNHGDPIIQSVNLPLSIIVTDVDDHDPQFIPCEGSDGEQCLPPVYTATLNLSNLDTVGMVSCEV